MPDTYKFILPLKLSYLLFLLLFLSSCEESLTLVIPEGEEKLVVEGHIEQDAPPVVVLTRSIPVFAPFSVNEVEKAFVHNARVTVSADGRDYPLTEISSANLPPELVQVISEQYGINLGSGGSSGFTFYFYTTPSLRGELGKNYRLTIEHEGQLLTSNTSIPHLNPLDSLWVVPHPNPKNDSLVTLWYRYRDPDTVGNCIRYFTKRNNEAFYPGRFNSVYNDEFVNNKPYVDFPLQRGEPKTQNLNRDTYSYFWKGDTIRIRWCAIDVEQYRFWQSLENDQNTTGSPFGSPSTVKSNVKGGLGIWGGYGVSYHQFIVPK